MSHPPFLLTCGDIYKIYDHTSYSDVEGKKFLCTHMVRIKQLVLDPKEFGLTLAT